MVGDMSQAPPPTAPEGSSAPAVPVCYRHPKRETYLRCVRCDRPICPECLREAPVGFQCPECVAEGHRSVRAARTIFGGSTKGALGYVTKTLIFINVAVMVASIASAGGQGMFGGGLGGLLGGSTPLTEWGAVWAGAFVVDDGRVYQIPGIADGEYYRLLTSMFLHYGLLHLALNMWALWVLGRELEERLGPGRFLLVYLLSGLGGSVAAYALSPFSMSAGASGAVFGLFAAIFVVFRRLNRDTSQIITILVINLVFSFSVSGISWQAHIGGLLVGAALAVAMTYPPREIRNKILSVVVAGLVITLGAIVVARTAALSGPFLT
jgi:membrane associated rhomboid family serine protease